MPKDFTAHIHDPQRAADFIKTLGTDTVHIRSFIPEHANLPGFDKPQLVYYLDLALITPEQRQALIEHIAGRFSLDPDQVAADLDHYGVPILAHNVIITVTNPHKWIDLYSDGRYDEKDDDDPWDEEDEDR